ncbi:acVLRF1 family peptidyl-tRNA hydrolase [Chloroflexota bacterium]
MISWLNELEAATSIAKSQYLSAGLSLTEVENLLGKVLYPQAVPHEMADLTVNSKTGAVLFWSPLRKYLVLPPFPIREEYSAQGCAVELLRSLLRRDFRIALVLVRLGAYAIGVCDGENLINSKVGTGLVHGRHKKGGSSQQRFRRHREKQIDYFLDRVCCHVQEQLGPHVQTLDYLVYGGARTTIISLQKRCPSLQWFDSLMLPPLLDIAQPRKAVLESAVSRVWSSRVIELHDDEISSES